MALFWILLVASAFIDFRTQSIQMVLIAFLIGSTRRYQIPMLIPHLDNCLELEQTLFIVLFLRFLQAPQRFRQQFTQFFELSAYFQSSSLFYWLLIA